MSDKEIRIGAEAERALNDPAIQRAFDDTREAIMERWASSPVGDKDGQHQLRLMLKLLGDVRANLERALSDGKLAAEELRISEQRKSPIQKLRSAIGV